MLGKVSSPDLRVYAVWMPVLKADDEEAATAASAEILDSRARHFWNPDLALGRQAPQVLHLDARHELAFDVFLVYGPDARWIGDELPAPTAWMHRMSQKDPRWMKPDALARVVSALLPER